MKDITPSDSVCPVLLDTTLKPFNKDLDLPGVLSLEDRDTLSEAVNKLQELGLTKDQANAVAGTGS